MGNLRKYNSPEY